jgi:hypothetical protein
MIDEADTSSASCGDSNLLSQSITPQAVDSPLSGATKKGIAAAPITFDWESKLSLLGDERFVGFNEVTEVMIIIKRFMIDRLYSHCVSSPWCVAFLLNTHK